MITNVQNINSEPRLWHYSMVLYQSLNNTLTRNHATHRNDRDGWVLTHPMMTFCSHNIVIVTESITQVQPTNGVSTTTVLIEFYQNIPISTLPNMIEAQFQPPSLMLPNISTVVNKQVQFKLSVHSEKKGLLHALRRAPCNSVLKFIWNIRLLILLQ